MAKKTSAEDKNQAIKGFISLLIVAAGFWFYWTHIRTPTPDASSLPPDEAAFIATVQSSMSAWNNAPNSVAQVPMPAQRAADICATLANLNIQNWLGTITGIDASSTTDTNGKHIASVDVEIAPGITISSNPQIALFSDGTGAIEEGDTIYQTITNMPVKTPVVFSGGFVPDKQNCIEELSLTTSGGMTSPDFAFRFTSLNGTAD